MRKVFVLSLIVLLYTISNDGFAQVRVRGGFLSDSVKVGEETRFSLSARYPSSQMVLFPDSSASFAPFEFIRKEYFATETDDSTSLDSVVYYLSTFEIDKNQGLQLPVYLLMEQDCTEYSSAADSIMLAEIVHEPLDSIAVEKLPLKESIAYHEVNYDINLVIVGIVVAAIVVVVLIIWIFFGKKIARALQAKRLKRRHAEFINTFTTKIEQIATSFSAPATENAIPHWKRYMEQLESRPYTKLTTKEMIILYQDDVLGQNLREIDRAIYGHNTTVTPALHELKSIADNHFQQKLKEVTHGK